jgi:hypothetical protein
LRQLIGKTPANLFRSWLRYPAPSASAWPSSGCCRHGRLLPEFAALYRWKAGAPIRIMRRFLPESMVDKNLRKYNGLPV